MRRSPTDTLIAAMEEAEKAQECMVIMTSSDGDIVWLCSSDKLTVKLGLVETVKQCIVGDIKAERDQ
jgi:hypothetical protein